MIKLKNILSEAYAWERKPGGKLPTLADVKRIHEQNYTTGGDSPGSRGTGWHPIDEEFVNNVLTDDMLTSIGIFINRYTKYMVPNPKWTMDQLDSSYKNYGSLYIRKKLDRFQIQHDDPTTLSWRYMGRNLRVFGSEFGGKLKGAGRYD